MTEPEGERASTPDILAAGAVVLRRGPEPEVLTVHRPRYDDWSLPKGKLDRGEELAACAVREVAEETGVRIRLTGALGSHSYPVGGRIKQVHWWVGEALEESGHTPDHEVDAVRWMPVAEAAQRLSYADERLRLTLALGQPPTVPLVIVRHAEALARGDWSRDDDERPLTGGGGRQSAALVPVFAAFGVRRLLSSSATRCVETMRPYAEATGLAVERLPELTEAQGRSEPAKVLAIMERVRDDTVRTGVPTVICGHRPVLPNMLSALDVPSPAFDTADLLVAQVTADAQVHSIAKMRLSFEPEA